MYTVVTDLITEQESGLKCLKKANIIILLGRLYFLYKNGEMPKLLFLIHVKGTSTVLSYKRDFKNVD
jgi:hypothetical protein